MSLDNSLLQRLGLTHPIIQAPMAGSGDTPSLVAAVANAGAIGFFGAAYLTPDQILSTAADVRKRTSRPFGINLFAPQPPGRLSQHPDAILARVAPFFGEVNLPAPSLPSVAADPFDDQLAAVLESGAASFSFTLGEIPAAAIKAIKNRGVYLIGTATTVEEAIALEASGVDAVVAQGSEAGGHRGSFPRNFESGMVGSIALVPQVVDAVQIPVIASGGIMDGRGIAAALVLGASAIQMGTAFLLCDESSASDAYREAILSAHEDQTRVTRAFSGRPARGLQNRFMKEVGAHEAEILPFPIQNALTRPLRTAAAKQGRAEFLSLWAGQGVRMARRLTAAKLIERLAKETDAAFSAPQKRSTASG